MTTESTITIISGVLETGVLTFVVYMIIKGLKERIIGLENVVETQKKTIETMDKRIFETEQISDLYKKMIEDFPKVIDDYRAVITKTKDETIYELKKIVEEKDIAIDDFKQRASIIEPEKNNEVQKIGQIFIDKSNKLLLDFVQKCHETNDKLYSTLINSKTLEDFITKSGYELIKIPDEKTAEYVFVDFKTYNPRTQFSSIRNQFYMITFGNKIYINNQTFNEFDKQYSEIHK